MTNIYDDPAVDNIQKMMHKRLQEMRDKYGDSDELTQSNLERYLKAKGINDHKK